MFVVVSFSLCMMAGASCCQQSYKRLSERTSGTQEVQLLFLCAAVNACSLFPFFSSFAIVQTNLRSENAALHAKLSRLQEVCVLIMQYCPFVDCYHDYPSPQTSENTPSTQKQAHESGASTSELQHLEREIASLRKERDELTEAKAKIGEVIGPLCVS